MPAKNVIITDEEKLNKIKKKIASAGPASLQVVSDFDRTITPCFVNGEKLDSIISILMQEKYLTPDYAAKAKALYDKYRPIEINPNISLPEKRAAMKEWWAIHFDLLIKSGLTKKDLAKVSRSEKIALRPGAPEFLNFLSAGHIPLIILSGTGLGVETITLLLQRFGKLSDNIHIVSNSFIWKGERAVGIKQPIIYTFNKDYTAVKNFGFLPKVKDRKNVILLGDNLGDADMIKGFAYDNIIKIGFLNERAKENLESYKQAFDIIILNDGPMDYVNVLLGELVRHQKTY